MFKENREFWLYYLGVIIMFFFLFAVIRYGFEDSTSFLFSGWPFSYIESGRLFPESKFQADPKKQYTAIVRTNLGDLQVQLYPQNAPNTVSNFVYLSNSGFYDGLKFHRLIKGYLLQGGSPNTYNDDLDDDKYGGPGYTIPDEINWDSLDFPDSLRKELALAGYESSKRVKSLEISKYSVVMAATGPNTNGSQFAIMLADNNDPRVLQLRGRITVFGRLIGGFDVLELMLNSPIINPTSSDPVPKDLEIVEIKIIVKD